MKTVVASKHFNPGYALVMVMVVSSVVLLILGSTLRWSMTNASLIDRNNQYFITSYASEAATEKVLANISRDFQESGEGAVYRNVATYANLVPTAAENSHWSGFDFSDGTGKANATHVVRLKPTVFTNLQSQYTGLLGMVSTYRVMSNAKMKNSPYTIFSAVSQEIQVATVPVFQFAIFYGMDLEVNPGPNMNITGRVHSNGAIYTQPQATLSFQSDVTAVAKINATKKPGDPSTRTMGTIKFLKEHDGGKSSLTLPIGTNNTPEAVRQVLEVPPAGESATSPMGSQRLYNQVDLIVLITNSITFTTTSKTNSGKVTVTTNYFTNNIIRATSGLANNFATIIPTNQAALFVDLSKSFYNKREGLTITPIDIDVGKLRSWSATNTVLRTVLTNLEVSSLYVDDQRPYGSSTQPAVRLVNGQTLPPLGLTVATAEPIYIKGHYNVPTAALATTNTTGTKPAAIMGDSINILSINWVDANGVDGLSSRIAGATTINAAFLAGIVSTGGGSYSGGVENFPRFLESWGSTRTFTYNGSMVVLFNSKVADAPWGTSDVYDAPDRKWCFDPNFMDSTKLPPCTPQLRSIVRASWAAVPPNTTNLVSNYSY